METTLTNPSTLGSRHGKNRNIVPAAIVAFGLITGAFILKGDTLPSWRSFVTWPVGLQFASQMKAELQARSQSRQSKFQRLSVKSVFYHPVGDFYSIEYAAFWKNVKFNFPEEAWESCTLPRKEGAYSGACYGVPIRIQ